MPNSQIRFPFLLSLLSVTGLAAAESKVDFDRDVRPILSEHCYQCHGPDEDAREAGLRLDIGDEAASVIDVESVDDSDLLVRMLETDPDLIMPPPETGKPLTAEQIETVRQWIADGAVFQDHWAFVAPVRPDVPKTAFDEWTRNPIDAFVAAKLVSQGIAPSRQADAATLMRRLSLDLTGLPPTPERVDAFTVAMESADDRERAYQDLVTELLDSPHYGERWGRLWLDAARYADSDGYEKDKPREAWFYRDWVIRSLNADRPYDDFIVRQLAGDLLPDATQDDRVATGFLRNSMVNEEGGADPEQFRMEGMYDRLDAIGKSVLGLTIQCAQCHTHKYDPIQHDDYYSMFAFLNNTHDAIIPVYTDDEQARRSEVLEIIRHQEATLRAKHSNWKQRITKWESELPTDDNVAWQTPALKFDENTINGVKYHFFEDGSYLPEGYRPTNWDPRSTGIYEGDRLTAIQIEMLNYPTLSRGGPGQSVDGTWTLSEIKLKVALSGDPDNFATVKFADARADLSPVQGELKPRYSNKKPDATKDPPKRVTGPVEYAIDGDELTAWTNEVGEPFANQTQVGWFELETPIEIPAGQHALIDLVLAQKHGGWNSDDNQTFNLGHQRVSMTGDKLPRSGPLPTSIRDILSVAPEKRRDADWDQLFSYWRTIQDEPNFVAANEAIANAWADHPHGATQLTLQELTTPRMTSVLERGDFLNPTHVVEPRVPEFLHPMKPSEEPDRLRLARWLVDRDSPTTARSIVNRVWQAYFATGLVETSDDLGSQSTPPSHAELLDWLAVELMDQSWSLKTLHRTIVSSATYRQSSVVKPELAEVDPYNRLLARGSRFRVPAETVRDIALASSGLLNSTIGGPSVTPPAPRFLFEPPASYGPKVWNDATDESRYRRAIYTFRFRSVLYPMLEAFDAVPGNTSCVRRSISNTPMQALTLLNEPLFLECAMALGGRAIAECDGDDVARVTFVLRQCVQRQPTDEEVTTLVRFVEEQRSRIASGELSAEEILRDRPDALAKPIDDINNAEWAAWTLASRVALNLDETITRE